MLLWSIIPEEIVFNGFEQAQEYESFQYLGRDVLVSREKNGERKIVRLLSSNPKDYCDQRFSPGATIKM